MCRNTQYKFKKLHRYADQIKSEGEKEKHTATQIRSEGEKQRTSPARPGARAGQHRARPGARAGLGLARA